MSADGLKRVSEALEHPHRRRALAALAERESPLSVTDLAVEVASGEGGVPDDETERERAERVRARLHHRHVPRLDDLGFLDYDRDRRAVSLTDRGERFVAVAERFASASD